MAGGDPSRAPDMIVEAVNGHRQLVGVERQLALLVEVLFDQLAQRFDGGAGRLQRHRLRARARPPPGAARPPAPRPPPPAPPRPPAAPPRAAALLPPVPP